MHGGKALLYQFNGDIQDCLNYRGIKLINQSCNEVVGKGSRKKIVHVSSVVAKQFNFTLERSTT